MGPVMYELVRSGLALFYTGIFWMMVWFVVEDRRAAPADRKPLLPLAIVLMAGSIYLIRGVVAPHGHDTSTRRPAATLAGVSGLDAVVQRGRSGR